jgi:hypothetical protein
MKRTILLSLAAFAMLILAVSAQAAGTTLSVANNGMDDATCGPEGMAPYRSIRRAIAHASAGDQIVVGPGLYGDINRDALVDPSGDSGEENRVMVPLVECPLCFPSSSKSSSPASLGATMSVWAVLGGCVNSASAAPMCSRNGSIRNIPRERSLDFSSFDRCLTRGIPSF